MVVRTKMGGFGTGEYVQTTPKKTRQGTGKHTKYAATSRNAARKRYKGQGRWMNLPFLVLVSIMITLYQSLKPIWIVTL